MNVLATSVHKGFVCALKRPLASNPRKRSVWRLHNRCSGKWVDTVVWIRQPGMLIVACLAGGLYEGWLAFSFVVFSFAYNAARFLLTTRVDTLAPDERSSGATPALGGPSGYGWLAKAQLALFFAKLVFLGLFIWNMYELLTRSVLLPNADA